MSGPLALDELLAGAMAECARIERSLRAAEREGVGVLLVRDDQGHLLEAYVCDDVPAGRLAEADGPLEQALQRPAPLVLAQAPASEPVVDVRAA